MFQHRGGEFILSVGTAVSIAFADNTRRIIAERGLKNRAVAERAGFSENQFSAILNKRRVVRDIDVIAIAQALGVKTNVVKGGFEKNRLTQQSGGSFVVIDTAQGGETGGTLAGRPQQCTAVRFPAGTSRRWRRLYPGAWGLWPPTSMRRVYTGALLAVTFCLPESLS